MGMKITMNVAKFKEQLKATADELNRATRPAAQAGAQIIYDRAKSIAAGLVSEKEHYFYGTATKALPRGKKKAAAYGPYRPGTLRDSIYQAFSQDNSFRDVSTYHISWNKDKAPYGAMVELGTSKAPAHSFIGRAVTETRAAVREAIKQRFLEEVAKA
jgi:HK97 gp10 family phage protein